MTTSTMKHYLTCLLIGLVLIGAHQSAAGANNEITTEAPEMTSSSEQLVTTTQAQPASVTTSAPKSATSTFASTSTSASISTSTITQAPSTKPPKIGDCPSKCNCTLKSVDCSHQEFTELPKFNQKSTFVEFNFHDNHLESVDLKQLPLATIEMLNLSDNLIKTIVPAASAKRVINEMKQLRVLDLSNNQLQTLDGLNTWRTPQLVELNLASNQLTKPGPVSPPPRAKLERLNLANMPGMKKLDDWLAGFTDSLQLLNLSGSMPGHYHLPDQVFAKKDNLRTLDLSNNELVEVPGVVRSITTIRRLILNGNALTSLRPADFINQQSLEHLEVSGCLRLLRVEPDTFVGLKYLETIVISNNPKFFDFSPNAFYSDGLGPAASKSYAQLNLLDLSNNSLSSLANPSHSSDVQIKELRLANNPWNCDCQLHWLVSGTPGGKQIGREPIHCKTPSIYKDLEITQFFQTVDCNVTESSMQKLVLMSFLLFLIVLTIAVFIQKTDLCRKLQWRDQYGTIYYTKASFPTTDSGGFPIDKV